MLRALAPHFRPNRFEFGVLPNFQKMGRRPEEWKGQMNKSQPNKSNRARKCRPQRHSKDEIQYLLGAEEQILQSISGRAPLTDVLDKICLSLNCQIANIVSFVSLPDHDARDLAISARNAGLFGLFPFCSKVMTDENDEPLGALEIYCCLSRAPYADESQLIERAECLAAIAIQRHNETAQQSNCVMRDGDPLQQRLLEAPVSVN